VTPASPVQQSAWLYVHGHTTHSLQHTRCTGHPRGSGDQTSPIFDLAVRKGGEASSAVPKGKVMGAGHRMSRQQKGNACPSTARLRGM